MGISRSEEPAPCPTSGTSDERPLANSILQLSRCLQLPNVLFPPVFTSDIRVASTSRDTSVAVTAIPFSPETLRPLLKAPPRKGHQTNRRKVKFAIFTDTPVKDELAAIEAARTVKKKVKKPNFEETKIRKR
ncbi:unnamed protein product [Pieris macdunnoughi]|uniref:Uncharacterized protein n=1 Tax=Pieris macdunnoughi TaxID=345717 RepID=A0A821Y378_9NEOP|nr:unnamed protein product [Pieris macdunnoughi]